MQVSFSKDNLYRRNVLTSDAQICVRGCGLSETTSHLFSLCNFFGLVWNHTLRWLDVVAVLPNEVATHFYQFSFLGGAAKSNRFYKLFGSQLCGKYGKNETIEFSMQKNASFYRLWKRLSQ